MADLLTLRRELLALLADTDSDLELVQEKVEAIIREIQRLAPGADDSPASNPN